MRFPRQEYWSGLLFPSPGDLHDPGIKPMSVEPAGLCACLSQPSGSYMLSVVFSELICSVQDWKVTSAPFLSSSGLLEDAPPRHAHGDLTSLAPHERLPEILVVPRVFEGNPVGEGTTRRGTASLPLGLALGSPIFPSGCEGKLGVALESLQGP